MFKYNLKGEFMIVCKVYVDKKNDKKFLVAELAKSKIPARITNILDNYPLTDDFRAVYVYPSNYVAISKEAVDALKNKIFVEKDVKENVFLADFTFQVDDYDKKIGTFGFLPGNSKNENQRKKIFNLKNTLYTDEYNLRLNIMDSMQKFDNEFLKGLELTEPLDDQKIKNLYENFIEEHSM